jgi:hypothetical protein
MPIAKEQAGFTTFRLGFGSGPLYKIQTVFIM